MSKFKVGDRVAVYHGRQRLIGVVKGIEAEWIDIGIDDEGPLYFYHSKQCRRLVKRERRRVWLTINKGDQEVHDFSWQPNNEPTTSMFEVVEFVEVRPRKERK